MKVPQTFTITIEQAGFLAQMKSGQRSAYIRSAIDNYRSGPVANMRRLTRYVKATNDLQAYIWSLEDEKHNIAVAEIMHQAFNYGAEQE